MVEQRFARLDQVAGDEQVAFRLGEAPEVASVIAPPKLAKLTHHPGIDVVEASVGFDQLLNQSQAHDVALMAAALADIGRSLRRNRLERASPSGASASRSTASRKGGGKRSDTVS